MPKIAGTGKNRLVKPTVQQLVDLRPGVAPEVAAEHLSRLGSDYFDTFDDKSIAVHVEGLSKLGRDNPVELVVHRAGTGMVECTVLSFDHQGVFSLITGLMAGTGFEISSGRVFTYRPAEKGTTNRRRPRTRRRGQRKEDGGSRLRARRIVDTFRGRLKEGRDIEIWRSALSARLREVMLLLETGGDDAVQQAKNRANESVADELTRTEVDIRPVMYPVQIEIDNSSGPYTSLRVTSEDTPAFLYALSAALSLCGVSIEGVRIDTVGSRVEDVIDVLDSSGARIVDQDKIDRIRMSVLLTKQFTYFLGNAPDPYSALCRFEIMVADVLNRPSRDQWLGIFSDPAALHDLARLLGTSNFMWEDFVRSQYEELMPMIGPDGLQRGEPWSREAMERRLEESMASAPDFDSKRTALNAFKDHETLLIDMEHILDAGADPRALAEPLTRVAETVVARAIDIVLERTVGRFGRPRTVGGLPARFAAFGLGKLGGEAMGYASDIELLLVYSDAGSTDGATRVSNAEFFEHLVNELNKFIESKREGIFRLDTRLRPYGNSGPKACSLEAFCNYYSPKGAARSFEHLALTRLRAIAGDAELGSQVERLRDEFVYGSRGVDLADFRSIREKQLEEKGQDVRYNAKFSAGALVDLEYYVQILQVQHGSSFPSLRTPRIHQALGGLREAGVLTADESEQLVRAYYFLRRLINGLRMLRGNALDLHLPEVESDEFRHLARRMGYARDGEMDPEKRLLVEFESETAAIRAFIERHFGSGSVDMRKRGSVVDLMLSPAPSDELRDSVLSKVGLKDTRRAYGNLKALADQPGAGRVFSRLAVLACDTLRRCPDPDMALNNWERFVNGLESAGAHYEAMLAQPKRLDILLGIFSGSQFLSDTLARNPELLDWVSNPIVLRGGRTPDRLREELDGFLAGAGDGPEWLDVLRRFRRREILLIGTRDIGLHYPVETTISGLSALADTLVGAALDKVWESLEKNEWEGLSRDVVDRFCIMALGKLGGRELNYSSDIDLLAVYDDRSTGANEESVRVLFARVMDRVRRSLTEHTGEGYAYRVDLRLRPHGSAGPLVQPLSALVAYYGQNAAQWEIQALLKMRPIAGAVEVGDSLMDEVAGILCRDRDFDATIASVLDMRERSLRNAAGRSGDVKTGLGGIRDVEFMVQGLQLVHLHSHPELLGGNTLATIDKLVEKRILTPETGHVVRDDYMFMRRVEHCLQIMEDRQIHAVPDDTEQLKALAQRLMGRESNAERLTKALSRTRARIRRMYSTHLSPPSR